MLIVYLIDSLGDNHFENIKKHTRIVEWPITSNFWQIKVLGNVIRNQARLSMFQTNLYFHVNKVFDFKLFNAVSVNNIKWQNEFLKHWQITSSTVLWVQNWIVLLRNEIILLYSNYIFHPETVCCSYRKKYCMYYYDSLCNKTFST